MLCNRNSMAYTGSQGESIEQRTYVLQVCVGHAQLAAVGQYTEHNTVQSSVGS
jgi:hypothetical protein